MSNTVLTVFTPTYNRAHTLKRTYEWMRRQTCKNFIWLVVDDGSTDNTKESVAQWQAVPDNGFELRYVWKPNGGLHTGYNKAIELADTELLVCIDSDDYMPEDAVEVINDFWKEHRSNNIAGFIGLDYTLDNKPIGGLFQIQKNPVRLIELEKIHSGDTKMVLRTDLLKKVYPQPTLHGEKNFNPIYMILLVDEMYPFLLLNENLCYVDYQEGGMTCNIWKQYRNSPYSFQALRLLNMQRSAVPILYKFKHAIHYVSGCLFIHSHNWFEHVPSRLMVVCAIPFGILLNIIVRWKTRK